MQISALNQRLDSLYGCYALCPAIVAHSVCTPPRVQHSTCSAHRCCLSMPRSTKSYLSVLSQEEMPPDSWSSHPTLSRPSCYTAKAVFNIPASTQVLRPTQASQLLQGLGSVCVPTYPTPAGRRACRQCLAADDGGRPLGLLAVGPPASTALSVRSCFRWCSCFACAGSCACRQCLAGQ
jgi:hypothetical protein